MSYHDDQEVAFLASAEAGVMHFASNPRYRSNDERVYFPINYPAVKDLLGKVLTNLDAMSLPDRAHKAARTLLTREVWRWWDTYCDNAVTSGMGDIAPVVTSGPIGREPSNRWGWKSEADYLASLSETTDAGPVAKNA